MKKRERTKLEKEKAELERVKHKQSMAARKTMFEEKKMIEDSQISAAKAEASARRFRQLDDSSEEDEVGGGEAALGEEGGEGEDGVVGGLD